MTSARRSPGRPSKLSSEIARTFCDLLRAGNSIRDACAGAGIAYNTVRAWTLKGEDPKARSEYREFLRQLRDAEANARLTLLGRIAGAAVKDWRAAAWILERRDPDGWGRRRLEVAGEGGGPERFEIDLRLPPAVRATLPLAPT